MATFEHTFTWVGEGATVIATGTFDDWTSSLPLTKGEDGKLSATAQLPYGQKILYKYVVDGQWQHNPNEAHEADESGNMNNVFTAPTKALEVEAVAETPVAVVAVPVGEAAVVEEPAKVDKVAAVVAVPVVEAAKVEEPVAVVEQPVKAAMSYASAAAAGASVAAAVIVASVTDAVKHNGASEDTVAKEVDATTAAAPPAPAVETAAPVAEAAKLEEKKDDSYLGAATAGLGGFVAGATVVAGKVLEAGHEAKTKALAVAEEARVAAHEASLAAHALAEEKKAEALAQAEVFKAQAKGYQAQAVEATTKAVDSGKAVVADLPFGASALKALGLQDDSPAPVVTPAPTPVVLNEPSANTLPSSTPDAIIIPLTAPDADVIVPNGVAAPLLVVAPTPVVDSAPATPPKDSKKGTFGRRQPSVASAAAAGAEGEQPVRTRKPSFFQKLFGKK